MQIAVNTTFFKTEPEGYDYFLREFFSTLAETYPQHNFIFFSDRPLHLPIQIPANITPVIVPLRAKNVIGLKWWYDVKLRTALKKHNADIFISTDGFCSLTATIPQVLFVADMAFLNHPQLIPSYRSLLYKLYASAFFRKAKAVTTISEFAKKEIAERYRIPGSKIINIQGAAKSIYKPLNWETREQIKDRYSNGCEYFLFAGALHEGETLLDVLKAFSLFKRRQHTNMKLLVTGKLLLQYADVLEKLKTYKFKDEVKLLGYFNEEELVKVSAAAYAFINPGFFKGFGVPVIEAMQAGVPIITFDSMKEIAGDAALYSSNDPETLAEQLKLIFKDEQLRNRLIEAGKLQAAKFSLNKTVSNLWQVIEQAVSK